MSPSRYLPTISGLDVFAEDFRDSLAIFRSTSLCQRRCSSPDNHLRRFPARANLPARCRRSREQNRATARRLQKSSAPDHSVNAMKISHIRRCTHSTRLRLPKHSYQTFNPRPTEKRQLSLPDWRLNYISRSRRWPPRATSYF